MKLVNTRPRSACHLAAKAALADLFENHIFIFALLRGIASLWSIVDMFVKDHWRTTFWIKATFRALLAMLLIVHAFRPVIASISLLSS
jgi:hypothetical protein